MVPCVNKLEETNIQVIASAPLQKRCRIRSPPEELKDENSTQTIVVKDDQTLLCFVLGVDAKQISSHFYAVFSCFLPRTELVIIEMVAIKFTPRIKLPILSTLRIVIT